MGESHIEQRKFSFCPTIEGYHPTQLVVECADCTRFVVACCLHESFGGDLYKPNQRTCHHFQLVFIDGACSGNGLPNARAGLGITIGNHKDYSWSVPVDDNIDPAAPRTSQRAELLAAIEGLKKLHQHKTDRRGHKNFTRKRIKPPTSFSAIPSKRGAYVRRKTANLDLFSKLDEYTTSLEQKHIAVGFHHVPREYNQKADKLAKRAAGL